MPFVMWTRVGPRKRVLHGGARWRNLTNTIEPSMCGGDAAFLSDYCDPLLRIRERVRVSLRRDQERVSY